MKPNSISSRESTQSLVRLYNPRVARTTDRRGDDIVSDSIKAFWAIASRGAYWLIDGARPAWTTDRNAMRIVQIPQFLDR